MQGALEGLPGVREVTLEFEKRRLVVSFDPSGVSHDVIEDTVRSLGFGVESEVLVPQVKV